MRNIDVVKAFREDLTQIRDGLLQIGEFIAAGDSTRAAKTLGTLNVTMGAHFKFEESLLPALEPFLSGSAHKIVAEHSEARNSARRLAEVLTYDDWSKTEQLEAGWWALRSLLEHVTTSEGLSVVMKRLSEEQLVGLGLRFQEARRSKAPLLNWSMDLESI